jgi:hypothetical protein
VAIRDGKYAVAPLPDALAGARRLDAEALYNPDRFRPRYDHRLGMPLLLGPSLGA